MNELRLDHIVDYCGISSNDDFINFENIIKFKYKMINTKHQLSKIYDFLSKYKDELDYDWFIKFRPEMKLLQQFNFNELSESAINARAREYMGPKKIKYGCSVNGEGPLRNIGDVYYNENEQHVCLDEIVYIFNRKIIDNFICKPIEDCLIQNEPFHSNTWKARNIELNVIGINFLNTKYNIYSGNINC
jgi:hypothetical protein